MKYSGPDIAVIADGAQARATRKEMEKEMTNQRTVRAILTTVFSDECQAAGPSLVDDVLSGTPPVHPEEGRPFPIGEVFEALKEGAEFIATCLTIYAALKGSHKRKPKDSEIKEELRKRDVKHRRITEKQADQIVDEVVRRG